MYLLKHLKNQVSPKAFLLPREKGDKKGLSCPVYFCKVMKKTEENPINIHPLLWGEIHERAEGCEGCCAGEDSLIGKED